MYIEKRDENGVLVGWTFGTSFINAPLHADHPVQAFIDGGGVVLLDPEWTFARVKEDAVNTLRARCKEQITVTGGWTLDRYLRATVGAEYEDPNAGAHASLYSTAINHQTDILKAAIYAIDETNKTVDQVKAEADALALTAFDTTTVPLTPYGGLI